MHSLSSHPHFVYELVDPRDNSIFYVGITIDLYERFKHHMHCDGTNVLKDQRIQEILSAGHLPIMRTREQIVGFEQALQREDYWIAHYTSLGIALLNAEITHPVNRQRLAGRQSNYEKVKAIILYRYVNREYPPDLSEDMKYWYEFNYFTKPTRQEKKSQSKRARTHIKSYQRGREWISETASEAM